MCFVCAYIFTTKSYNTTYYLLVPLEYDLFSVLYFKNIFMNGNDEWIWYLQKKKKKIKSEKKTLKKNIKKKTTNKNI